ncbi:uncharacterized protein LOC112041943 [Lingula anatina]|uniref:Uncharacterized protein LOC112041943 n=1 Tax=Lingula anatina TaxID=7574 RepID=A0A2R2MMP0_LINAN|nr:uncharacterized protein LOC112041943 [Lingula anatina]|eukprot:XP_023931498.1 uncharacterized protein LOC112041943 [Lingula anatina]
MVNSSEIHIVWDCNGGDDVFIIDRDSPLVKGCVKEGYCVFLDYYGSEDPIDPDTSTHKVSLRFGSCWTKKLPLAMKTCLGDFRPCDNNNGGCEHICEMSPGRTCSCHDGYVLNSDGYSCDPLPPTTLPPTTEEPTTPPPSGNCSCADPTGKGHWSPVLTSYQAGGCLSLQPTNFDAASAEKYCRYLDGEDSMKLHLVRFYTKTDWDNIEKWLQSFGFTESRIYWTGGKVKYICGSKIMIQWNSDGYKDILWIDRQDPNNPFKVQGSAKVNYCVQLHYKGSTEPIDPNSQSHKIVLQFATCKANKMPLCQKNCDGALSSTPCVCRAAANMDYTTYDQSNIHFDGTCRYLLSGYCPAGDPSLPGFKVDIDHKDGSSTARFVDVTIDSHVVRLGPGLAIQLNGESICAPMNIGNKIRIGMLPNYNTYVATNFGLRVTFDNNHVTVRAPSSYKDEMCGICGSCNDNAIDDYTTASGQDVSSLDPEERDNEIGISYQIEGGSQECTNGTTNVDTPCSVDDLVKANSINFCGLLNSPDGAFAECIASGRVQSTQDRLDSCVRDVCSLSVKSWKKAKESACSVLEEFATECRQAGVGTGDWRAASGCCE